jgi:ABC-type Fe3+/spermidine/putrescine transport system ATPase subunit
MTTDESPDMKETADEQVPTDATASESALEVSGMTKIYPDGTLAVDDIDFSVDYGDFCVIIGPSGCGKSTTLHSIVGKIPPTEGSIVLDGKDITTAPTYERDIGLVFQDFQLFPHLSVEENIRYGPERMNLPEDEIQRRFEEVVELMRLEPLTNRDPGELSAGQQQRVALARSIVLQPKLLLLDEPLGDMDYKLQKRMEREILRIHRELDTTFVYVTHDQTQAMRLADQIVVMNDGQIEQSGSVEEVYNAPATAFVATFVGDSNSFRGTVTGIEDGGDSVTVDTPLGEFAVSTANLTSSPQSVLDEQIMFAVRPQSVEISETKDNTMTGSISSLIEQPGKGTQLITEITGPDGATKDIEARIYGEHDLSTESQSVTLGWDAVDGHLLEQLSVVSGIDLETDILGE